LFYGKLREEIIADKVTHLKEVYDMFGGRVGAQELIIVLVLALIIFGPRKLPEIGSALGKSLREFKKATSEVKKSISLDDEDEATEKEQTGEKKDQPAPKPAAEEKPPAEDPVE
jgi:sec-independent protein translocase protein TatA